MKVKDLIESRSDVYSIPEDMSVHEAARYLREKGLRAVGICNPAGKLVGCISQSDISDKVAAENKCPAWMRVTEIMSTDLVLATPDTPLDDCLRMMEEHGIFHLLVVDDQSRYRGMISVADLLRVIATNHKDRADMLESYIFPQR